MAEWVDGWLARAVGVVWAASAIALSPLGAAAQESEPPPAAPASEPRTAAPTAGEGATVEPLTSSAAAIPAGPDVDAAAVPIEEKKTRVETMLKEQRSDLVRATELVAEARSRKDIVQLNCVNEKTTQVKGLLKISEQASLQMYEAIANSATDLSNHAFTKVSVAHRKSRVVRAEGEQCVGKDFLTAGNATVDVEVEDGAGGTAGSDPTAGSAPPPGPTVPPVASTF